MKKIPCLFVRDFTDKRNPILLREITPGCEWVAQGEGIATRKWDGTAIAIIGGKLFARYDVGRKTLPVGAISCGEPDIISGHNPAWVMADKSEHRWIREAHGGHHYEDGTYEAIGPKINSNHEGVVAHCLKRHGDEILDAPRDFDGLFDYLKSRSIEGIVFRHESGSMCKIRRHDYGLPWPVI